MAQNVPLSRLIIDHRGRREVFEVLEDALVVGRDADSGLLLDDHRVSRQHARIRRVDGALRIEDLGSANGTYVNGLPIFESTPLNAGDRIDVGGNVILWIGRAPQGQATTVPNPAPPSPTVQASTTAPADAPPPAVHSGPDRTDNDAAPSIGGRARRKGQSSKVPFIAAVVVGVVIVGFLKLRSEPPTTTSESAELSAAHGKDTGEGDPGKPASPGATGDNVTAKTDDDSEYRTAPELPHDTEADLERDFNLALIDQRFQAAWRIADRLDRDRGAPLLDRLRGEMSRAVKKVEIETRSRRQRSGRSNAAAYLRSQLAAFPPASNAHTELTGLLFEFMPPAAPRSPVPGVAEGPKPSKPAPVAAKTTKPKVVAPRPTVARTSEEMNQARALVDAGNAALADGRYEEAEKTFTDALVLVRDTGDRLMRRAQRGQRQASAHLGVIDALIAVAGEDPGSLGRIPHVPGKSGRVLRLDARGLTFQGPDGPLPVAWRVLPKRAFSAVLKKAALPPTAMVDASIWLRGYGDLENEQLQAEADRLLARAFRKDEELRERIEIALADARQIPLPEKGFALVKDEWLSPGQLARRRLNDIVDTAVKDVESDDDAKREEAVAILAGLGETARSSLYRALLTRRAILKNRLNDLKVVKHINTLGMRRIEVEKAREHALSLIFDTSKYPYPYRPPNATQAAHEEYRKHQPIVGRRVAVLRKLWDVPDAVAVPDDVHQLVAQVREVNAVIIDAGFGEIPEDQNPSPWLMHLPTTGEPLTIRNIALSGAERERIDQSNIVMASNEANTGTATRAEVAQIRITNEYRTMMGRWALRLYERLTLASHGHCADMAKGGFFSHISPVPGKRTPHDRAVKAGMAPSGASENIAINRSPQGAHNAWVHSPGHHRNILGRSWRLMGPGNVGRYWCQNFSVADRNEEKDEAPVGEAK